MAAIGMPMTDDVRLRLFDHWHLAVVILTIRVRIYLSPMPVKQRVLLDN